MCVCVCVCVCVYLTALISRAGIDEQVKYSLIIDLQHRDAEGKVEAVHGGTVRSLKEILHRPVRNPWVIRGAHHRVSGSFAGPTTHRHRHRDRQHTHTPGSFAGPIIVQVGHSQGPPHTHTQPHTWVIRGAHHGVSFPSACLTICEDAAVVTCRV